MAKCLEITCLPKSVFYEGALNIPLIVRPPSGTQSWKAYALTDHYDICSTLLDAAGAENLEINRGLSLRPKIEAGSDAKDVQPNKGVVFSEVNLYSMARTERYKMTIDSLTRKPWNCTTWRTIQTNSETWSTNSGIRPYAISSWRSTSVSYW